MDIPVTNILFVCSPDKVPKGYTAITMCPCGHDAQLWEKVIGGESGTRYLCFTKEEQKDGKILEDMYIPGPSNQYLKADYKIIVDTVEGEEPMRHKQLAFKRTSKSDVTKAVVDIIVCRSKDTISSLYTKLTKVNGLRIAFRTAKYEPKSVSAADISSKFDNLSIANQGSKVQTNLNATTSPSIVSQPPSGISPGTMDNASVRDVGGVKVKHVDSVATHPPPPSSISPPKSALGSANISSDGTQSHGTSGTPSAPPTASAKPSAPPTATPTSYPPSSPAYLNPSPDSNVPTPSAPSPAPPTQITTPTPYPPSTQGQYSIGTNVPYGQPPLQSGGGVYPYAPPPTTTVGGAYPYAPPPTTTSYNTNIGFSFGGPMYSGGGSYPPPTAPYNPYQQQQQPGYPPPYGPPGPQGGYNPMFPQPTQQNYSNVKYGFNF